MEVQTGDSGAGGAGGAAAGGAAAGAIHNGGEAPAGASETKVTVNADGNPKAAPAAPAMEWTKDFDADTKDFVTQRGFKDPKTVVESFRNLEKLRGVPMDRLLKLPDQTVAADDKQWSDVYEKLGKPATPEGYGLTPKDPNNAGFTNWAKDAFHKLNITTAQGQELVKQFNAFNEQMEAQEAAAHTAKVQEQVGNLKKEWGAAFEQNMARAQAAFRRFGVDGKAVDTLEKVIGFDGVMKMFNQMGTQVGEHGFIAGDPMATSFGEGVVLTPEQANARIKALKQDTDFAARYIKGEVKAKQEMERLMKMANPTD